MNLLLIALAAMVGAIQAPPQRLSSSIEGIVVKLGTGEPLANASVQLNMEVSGDRRSETPEPPPSQILREQLHRKAKSDGNGRFIFENVAPGEYRLIATYDGDYVPVEYGQRSPTGQGIPFAIAAGQKMTGIQLAMPPTGAISGRVYDRDGEPLGKAQILALRPVYKNGRRTMTIVQTAQSDDRGEYRLFWLAPGRYYVGVKPDIAEFPIMGRSVTYNAAVTRVMPPTRFGTFEQATSPVVHRRRLKTGDVVEEMYLPVYYPNTVDMLAAAAISVPSGTTVGGVDIAAGAGLITPRHIRGRVVHQATGQPVGAAILTAMPLTTDPHSSMASTQSAADGTFDIPGVAPGSYQVFASAHSSTRSLDGMAAVEVAQKDIENIPIVMTSAFKLSGRFVMEGGVRSSNSQISLPRLGRLIRDPEVMGMSSGFPSFNPPANPDGSFTVDGILPGDFRVTLQGVPVDGYVKSMRMGNVDVLNDGLHIAGPPDTLLEVVIGANAGRIEGSVVNTRNESLSNRTVVLVPDVRLRQRSDLYKVVSTDSAGRFQMQGVTPGDYKLFAWENVETGAWQDPDFMRAYENAGRPIRIIEGSNENLQLPVIP